MLTMNNNRQQNDPKLRLYPIPVRDQLFIVGNPAELNAIKLFNIVGIEQNITYHIVGDRVVLDMAYLKQGAYFLQTRTMSHIVLKQ